MTSPTLSILMPVYNELATAEAAIDQLAACDFGVPIELVIVDDGSTDGTTEILFKRAENEPWMSVHVHERNQGKGAAIRTSLDLASGQYACIYDADLEYDPKDMRKLLEPLLSGRAEISYGARSFESHTAHSFWYVVGNRSVTLAANVLFNCFMRDMMTCYKMMRLELYRSLDLTSDGFALEAEITGKVLALGYKIHEVPISYAARSHAQGKKLKSSDAWSVLAVLLKIRGSRRYKRLRAHRS